MTSALLSKHSERLASGHRINRAADDAAGLAISEKFRSNVRALTQARRNTADGISLVQVTEGGLQEISNILGRLKELSVQAASDTIGNTERGFIQKEFSALKNEIDRIATSTEFNGTHVLTGQSPLPPSLLVNSNSFPLEIQVGMSHQPEVDSPSSPNPVNIIRVPLERINALTYGEGSLNLDAPPGTRDEKDPEISALVDTKKSAQIAMTKVDDALNRVNEYRADLGAIQNRLEHAVNNTSLTIENLEAAKSRIQDTDYAEESSAVVQYNILQQAGISVLAQANQFPQLALKLLG